MRVFWIAAILLTTSLLSPAQTTSPSIQQLIKDAAYNELHDRERDSFWQYSIQQRLGAQSFVKYQVETGQGPIYRIIEKDGHRLTPDQQREEEARLSALMNNPGALAKNRDSHLQDEERMQRLLALMPDAFLYEPDGQSSGDLLTLKFWPNPAFKPPTYEARVFHGMAGTMVVNQKAKRIVAVHGTIINRIDFGYGLLGYVDKGGRFELHREQVSDTRWKTDLVDVHVSGRVILFKSVSKDHYEARSQFQPVETTISLPETRRILDQAATENQASLSVPEHK